MNIAHGAVRVRIFTKSLLLILGNTVFMQTRSMLLLIVITVARMATAKESRTALLGLVSASLLATVVCSVVAEVSPTEATFLHVLLLLELSTGLAQMVGLLLARGTEVVLTLRASDSKLAHVLCSSLVDELAGIILDVIVYLALEDLNQVSTLALHYVVVPLKCFISHTRLKFLISLLSESVSDLIVS